MIDYPSILADAGLDVVEYPGWRDRTSGGGWEPRAIIVHHDASAEGPSPGTRNYIAEGSSISPLSQLWVDYSGRWHVLAHGNANHAGRGDGWGVIPAGEGNAYAIGIETDFTTGEALNPDFYDSVVRGVAALCAALGYDPDEAVCGHKEYAPGRKVDPDWSMEQFREDVKALLASGVKAASIGDIEPVEEPEVTLREGDQGPAVALLQECLSREAIVAGREEQGIDYEEPVGTFGPTTRAAVRRYQRAAGLKPTGACDAITFTLLLRYERDKPDEVAA